MESILTPLALKRGDRVRIVSPATTPTEEGVLNCARIYENWGLTVEFGRSIFATDGFLAGSDRERLADINDALRDDGVRAIFATRGGKGSYRIADKLDFTAAKKNPKFIVGFSDITALHLALFRTCAVTSIHGPLSSWNVDIVGSQSVESLRSALMDCKPVKIRSLADEPTSLLTTSGRASGPLIGGNLDTLAICAGWALPNLKGCILFLEAADMFVGHVDRQLTMLTKAGHLDGIEGIAFGQFTSLKADLDTGFFRILQEHATRLAVPVLGGLPLGHGKNPLTIPIGTNAVLDADNGTLTVESGAT